MTTMHVMSQRLQMCITSMCMMCYLLPHCMPHMHVACHAVQQQVAFYRAQACTEMHQPCVLCCTVLSVGWHHWPAAGAATAAGGGMAVVP